MAVATNNLTNLYLYTRYERFWHWLQTVLIVLLLITGFETKGLYTLMGFKTATEVHNFVGNTWLIAFLFFAFWIATTGEWRQYIPTTKKMVKVLRYYLYGIFRGEPHPVPKRKDAKHNPLQRITYLILAAILLPVQMATGLLAGMGAGGPVAQRGSSNSYGRCLWHLILCDRSYLYDHHRPYHPGTYPRHDFRLGGSKRHRSR
jgi:thiosulfate reductase cytochrome b subunit